MKKILGLLGAALIAVVFICIPFPAGDLHIRLLFDDFAGDGCTLYYATDQSPELSQDKSIYSAIGEDRQVDFCLDASLAGHITNLRIDWPDKEQLLCVKNVSASSAGVVQREFDPSIFFAPGNIVSQNNIKDISLVRIRNRAYILTGADDPYMMLSQGMVERIQKCFSHYRLTRLMICVFIFGCAIFCKKGPFRVKAEEI